MISKSFYYQLRNSALKYDLLGPPELMREHVVAASKAMRRGDWRQCRDYVIDKTMNAKVRTAPQGELRVCGSSIAPGNPW